MDRERLIEELAVAICFGLNAPQCVAWEETEPYLVETYRRMARHALFRLEALGLAVVEKAKLRDGRLIEELAGAMEEALAEIEPRARLALRVYAGTLASASVSRLEALGLDTAMLSAAEGGGK